MLKRRAVALWIGCFALAGNSALRAQQQPLAPVAPAVPVVRVAPVVPVVRVAPVVKELPGPAGGPKTLLVRFTPPVVEVGLSASAGARVRVPNGGRWSDPRSADAPLAAAPGRFIGALLIELPPGGELTALAGSARADAGRRGLNADVTTPVPIERLPRFWSSWSVTAPGVRAGQPVRVPLPLELFVLPDIGPENVRPLRGEQVLPFALEEATALEPVDARVEPVSGGFSVALPAFGAQLTQLQLIAPPGEWTANIAVDYRAVSRRGQPLRTVEGPRADWRCAAKEAAGCSLLVPLAPPPGAPSLVVTGMLPAGTMVRLWAPVSSLVFAWPAQGGDGHVRLVSGFDPVRADAPQVRSVRAQLAGAMARPGSVDPAATLAETERLAARAPWIVAAASALATALLLFVVVRSVSRTRRGRAAGQ